MRSPHLILRLDRFPESSTATWFNGIDLVPSFNDRSEVASVVATLPNSTTVQHVNYSYNLGGGNNGSLTSTSDSINSNLSETFAYDNLDRINSASTAASSGSGCWGQTYGTSGGLSADLWGNLSQINSTNCSTGTLSVTVSSSTNRFSSSGYSYDLVGNMTNDTQFSYGFDAEHRITAAAGTSTGTWTYVYDGKGARVEKKNSTGGTLYFRSPSGTALSETDLNGNVLNEYVFLGGQRIAWRDF
jgi:YD repeat-containing protein